MLYKGIRAGRFHEGGGQGAWCIPETRKPRGPSLTWKLGSKLKCGLWERELMKRASAVAPKLEGNCGVTSLQGPDIKLRANVQTCPLPQPCSHTTGIQYYWQFIHYKSIQKHPGSKSHTTKGRPIFSYAKYHYFASYSLYLSSYLQKFSSVFN